MSSEAVIELRGVGKRYLLGRDDQATDTLRDAVLSVARRARRSGDQERRRTELWSLRDIDLTVRQGEVVGIVGRNGAGKSTLLKLLTRITEPTRGRLRTRGRVGALLEVGTGFHPELTGRENVYLNGAILGLSRREVAAQFPAIVDFAGVERFVDTPVKRFSSGMYLRLAFAVAAQLQSEILVIDEVLAVGDAEFQRKCLGKIAEVEREGRTILFVSHNLDAVQRLCQRTVWLERGSIAAEGATSEVLSRYLTSGLARTAGSTYADEDPERPVWLRSVTLLDAHGEPAASQLPRDAPFAVEIDMVVRQPVPGLDLAVVLQNSRGVRVLDEAWSDNGPAERGHVGTYRLRMTIPPVLAVGDYSVGVWVGSAYESLIWKEDAVVFGLSGHAAHRPERVLQLDLGLEITTRTLER